jgi:hypothetical protein
MNWLMRQMEKPGRVVKLEWDLKVVSECWR